MKKRKTLEEAKQGVMSEVRQNFRDFMAAWEVGKPFCYWFGPTTTHRRWLKGSGATQWGTDPDNPQRAIRTHDCLLIINFKPERNPMGDPYDLDTPDEPELDELDRNTKATLPDEDTSPTKAWLVTHRNDPAWRPYFDRAYGKRPRLELYDLRRDPDQINNVAANPEYSEVVQRLENKLMTELKATSDPRLIDDGRFFEEVEKSNYSRKKQ